MTDLCVLLVVVWFETMGVFGVFICGLDIALGGEFCWLGLIVDLVGVVDFGF